MNKMRLPLYTYRRSYNLLSLDALAREQVNLRVHEASLDNYRRVSMHGKKASLWHDPAYDYARSVYRINHSAVDRLIRDLIADWSKAERKAFRVKQQGEVIDILNRNAAERAAHRAKANRTPAPRSPSSKGRAASKGRSLDAQAKLDLCQRMGWTVKEPIK